ncbi:hypothetical protein C2G38_2194244 [Gigaspora rosea]|uniref:Uncharacterized protein n=1 Tax=Gigaspora rosea TaxID=44941 RepID=A0A397UWU8_9GLOM|nr:hypothetical protein C2G38_2194244 [Gigaspora rosea]
MGIYRSNKHRFQLKNANRIRLEKHQRNKVLKEQSASVNEVSTNEVSTNELSTNEDIINTFGNFLKNNTLALQILAQAGINQTRIDTMKIGVAVKCGINFEDGQIPNNPS